MDVIFITSVFQINKHQEYLNYLKRKRFRRNQVEREIEQMSEAVNELRKIVASILEFGLLVNTNAQSHIDRCNILIRKFKAIIRKFEDRMEVFGYDTIGSDSYDSELNYSSDNSD